MAAATFARPPTPRAAPRLSYTVRPAISAFRASNGAPDGVATTCTGPRCASSARRGVVRTTSPRNEVWTTRENCTRSSVAKAAHDRQRSIHLQHGEERFLGDLHGADLLHALLSFLLLLEELPLSRDVTPVAFREHVLAKRLHRRTRDHLVADGRLDRHLEQLPRNELSQLVGDLPAVFVRLVAVDDHAERVYRVAVDQHVEPYEIALAIPEHLVVERGVAAADRLQSVEEVEDDLGERELPVELHARLVEVRHVLIDPAPFRAERHDRADVVRRR